MEVLTEDKDPFHVASTARGWPLRLLHVPSMTSVERVGDSTYNNQTAPEYNAVSYTWGRWQCSHGPALVVHNISWTVPPVRSDCFSVDEFHKVITRASHGVEYVWLDIACIDQDDRRAKMLEIGRQAEIFRGAKSVYVWLRSIDTAMLQSQMDELSKAASRLEEEQYSNEAYIYDSLDVMPELACLSDQDWISAIKKALHMLKQDPWFTSLWTLQEMYLAPIAVLLSHDANPACHAVDGQEMVIGTITIWINIIYDAILMFSQGRKLSQEPNWTELSCISTFVEELGLVGSNVNNPCMLYSATRFREAMDPLDRVYGIMQVFGLCLGESSKPGDTFTLGQLEIELGAALNERSPVWAQLFVRSQPAQPGNCWLFDQYSFIPARLCFAETFPKSDCSIYVDTAQQARIKGKACLFQSMLELWRVKSAPLVDMEEIQRPWVTSEIFFDAINLDLGLILSLKGLYPYNYIMKDEFREELLRLFGSDLYIILIGVLSEAAEDDTDLSLGMIVVRMSRQRQVAWQRIGICVWHSDMEIAVPIQGDLWNSIEGVLD